jgi:hypothetical protein
MTPYSPQLQDTLGKLSHCHDMCLSMALTHCLEMGGEHARPQHIRLMLDCVAICDTARDAILRKSQFHSGILSLCADICETCAAACASLGQMEDCVAACRACMKACREAARQDHAEIITAAERVVPI